MNNDEFRAAAHQMVDWICDFREGVEQRPVASQVAPGAIRQRLAALPPEQGEDLAALMADLSEVVAPGITNTQHPMHFGWFPSNASLASVLGDFASSGIAGLGISWESCPALTEVEEVVCDWLRQLTGLSSAWQGTIHDTASTATLTALLVARERASDYCQNRAGLQDYERAMTVYCTEQAHSSVKKAALLAGFGNANLRVIDMLPGHYHMDVAALQRQLQADVDAGLQPTAIVASLGSTGVTAFDPLADIIAVAQPYNIWVHADAAMAGSAMLLPECRHLWQGIEQADSLVWNPHKWMGTILDTSLFYVRDSEALIRTMSTNPSYLRSGVDGEVTQYRDWGIPLGRRFRALKLWFHLRLDGIASIQARLRRDLANTQWLAEQIQHSDDWHLLAPVTLQTLCVVHQPAGLEGEQLDAHTLRWLQRINASGEAFMSGAVLDGRWMVRISIGAESTEQHHLAVLWQRLQVVADECLTESRSGQ